MKLNSFVFVLLLLLFINLSSSQYSNYLNITGPGCGIYDYVQVGYCTNTCGTFMAVTIYTNTSFELNLFNDNQCNNYATSMGTFECLPNHQEVYAGNFSVYCNEISTPTPTIPTSTPTSTPTPTPTPSGITHDYIVQIDRCNETIYANIDTCYYQCNSSFVLREVSFQSNYYNLTYYLDPMCRFRSDNYFFTCNYPGQSFYIGYLNTGFTCISNISTPTPSGTPTPTPSISSTPIPSGTPTPTPTPTPSDNLIQVYVCNSSINAIIGTCYAHACNSSFNIVKNEWSINSYNISTYYDFMCSFQKDEYVFSCQYPGQSLYISSLDIVVSCPQSLTQSPTLTPTTTPVPSSSSDSIQAEIECDYSLNGILVINSTEPIECRGIGETFCRINQHTTCSTDNVDNIGAVKCTTDFGIIQCTGNHIKCKSSIVKCSVKPNIQNLIVNGIENPSNYYNHQEHSLLYINGQSESSTASKTFKYSFLILIILSIILL